MTIDDIAKLADAASKVLGAIAWPVVIICLIRYFGRPLRFFLANLSEGSIKAFGVEATAKRNASLHLATAELIQSPAVSNEAPKAAIAAQAENFFRSAEALTDAISVQNLQGKSLLWVDDFPEATVYERKALMSLGLKMDVAVSTEAAVALVRQNPYSAAVILPRHILESREGYELILRLEHLNIPFIIHGKSDLLEPTIVGAASATTTSASALLLAINSLLIRPKEIWRYFR
jgi:hypothetical protein